MPHPRGNDLNPGTCADADAELRENAERELTRLTEKALFPGPPIPPGDSFESQLLPDLGARRRPRTPAGFTCIPGGEAGWGQ